MSIILGSYTFPNTFYIASVSGDNRLPTEDIPRRDGVAIGDVTLKEKIVQIRGMLRSDTVAGMQTARDGLMAALHAGRQKLYLQSDRYIYASLNSFASDYDPASLNRYCDVSIDLLCDDPFWISETESSDIWSNPSFNSSHNIAIGGNAYILPVFELTAATTGTWIDVRITVGTTQVCLSGTVAAGDILVIDCANQTVTLKATTADKMSYFTGSFLKLTGNATNSLKLDGAGPSVSQIVTRWRNRWY